MTEQKTPREIAEIGFRNCTADGRPVEMFLSWIEMAIFAERVETSRIYEQLVKMEHDFVEERASLRNSRDKWVEIVSEGRSNLERLQKQLDEQSEINTVNYLEEKRLAAENRVLADALKFYADKEVWHGRRTHSENAASDLEWDSGTSARKALSASPLTEKHRKVFEAKERVIEVARVTRAHTERLEDAVDALEAAEKELGE